MESQPQNPEFRNSPDNFHPCLYTASFFPVHYSLFVCFCCFKSQSTYSYGHGRAVNWSNHTFSWASLNKQINHKFMHILSLVSDNPS